jgi:hypothetical protein
LAYWSGEDRPFGHAHFFERAMRAEMSRSLFLKRGAVAVGGLAGLGLLGSAPAFAQSGADPRPIPGGFDENFIPVPSDPLVHVLPPAIGFEMSTITDFNGVVGAADIQGTAQGSDGSTYVFDTDMRFMQGEYVGMDGRMRQRSFAFI